MSPVTSYYKKATNVIASIQPVAIYKLLLVTWLVTKLISYNLWFQWDRILPRVTAFHFLSWDRLAIFDVSIATFSFILILYSLIKVKPKIIFTIVVLEVILCVFDVIRIQPFQFQMLILSSIYIMDSKKFSVNLLLFLSATYVFAGLCKFNLGFINVNWSYFFLENSLGIKRSIAQIPMLKAFGFIIPLSEALLGVALLTKYKNTACFALILFHSFTLLYIGSFFLNINHAVWPWNLSMIILLLYLRYQPSLTVNKSIFKKTYQKMYVLILFVLPFLAYTKYYHPYLAFQLYPGNTTFLVIQSNSEKLAAFHQEKYKSLKVEDYAYFSLARHISFNQFNVPIASVPWLHNRLIETIISNNTFGQVEFYTLSYPYKKLQKHKY